MWHAGLAHKSLLKVRFRCKACHASNSASAAPQNQANCNAQKFVRWAAMCNASKEIASALIAGVIVVVADWKNSASAAPQNQLHLALAKKSA